MFNYREQKCAVCVQPVYHSIQLNHVISDLGYLCLWGAMAQRKQIVSVSVN